MSSPGLWYLHSSSASFLFHTYLPEAFALSLKCLSYLKVLPFASLFVSLSTSYTGKEFFKGLQKTSVLVKKA